MEISSSRHSCLSLFSPTHSDRELYRKTPIDAVRPIGGRVAFDAFPRFGGAAPSRACPAADSDDLGRTRLRSRRHARESRACRLLGDVVRAVPSGIPGYRKVLQEAPRGGFRGDRAQHRQAARPAENAKAYRQASFRCRAFERNDTNGFGTPEAVPVSYVIDLKVSSGISSSPSTTTF